MIPHHRPRRVVVEHVAHNFYRLPDMGAAIDKVAYKHRAARSSWKAPCAAAMAVSQLEKKLLQGFRMAMNITNDIEHACNWIQGGQEFQG